MHLYGIVFFNSLRIRLWCIHLTLSSARFPLGAPSGREPFVCRSFALVADLVEASVESRSLFATLHSK